jgi:hypothetical protein
MVRRQRIRATGRRTIRVDDEQLARVLVMIAEDIARRAAGQDLNNEEDLEQ